MAMMLPKLPQQDGLQKFFSVLQGLLFIVLFGALIYVIWHLKIILILKIILVIAAYIVVALFTYLVLRPLCMYIEAWVRRRRGR